MCPALFPVKRNTLASATAVVAKEAAISATAAAEQKQKNDPAAVAAIAGKTAAIISVAAQSKKNQQPANGDSAIVFASTSTVCSS